MKTIPVVVTPSYIGFQCVEAAGWDLGHPIGYGNCEKEAMSDFAESWELKRDEIITPIQIK